MFKIDPDWIPLGAGAYAGRDETLHISIEEMLASKGIPCTERNQQILIEALRDVFPTASVIEDEHK